MAAVVAAREIIVLAGPAAPYEAAVKPMKTYLLSPASANGQIDAVEAKLRGIIPDLRKITGIENIAEEIGSRGRRNRCDFSFALVARGGDQ